jgi:hypothetical protein
MTQTTDRRKRQAIDQGKLQTEARELTESIQQFRGHANATPALLHIGNGSHPGADMGTDSQGRRWFSMAGPLPAGASLRPAAIYTLDGSDYTIDRHQRESERGECWALVQWTDAKAPDAGEVYRGKPVRRKRRPVTVEPVPTVAERLEYLRGEIRAERISYGEIAELQGLAEYIDPADVELLQWAGVPEKVD